MVVHLKPSDFFVTRNNELANNIKGFSVVFFKSDKCVYCNDVMPAFLQASSSIQGCTFAIMNVDQDNMRIVRIAEITVNPLKYVPYVVLYVNGIPATVFNPDEQNPDANAKLLKDFIVKNAALIKTGKKIELAVSSSSSESKQRVCETSTGIAICGIKSRGKCYMSAEMAYKSAK